VITGLNSQPGPFSEGFITIQEAPATRKKGFLDRTGKWLVKPQYSEAWDFSEGLAAVCNNWKWGYVGTTGKLVIPLTFDEAESFSEGLAPVRIENTRAIPAMQPGQNVPTVPGEYGYIDKIGQFVIKPRFYKAERFRDGLAQVWLIDPELGGSPCYIDRTGKVVWDPAAKH
jgi:hypothetical protein